MWKMLPIPAPLIDSTSLANHNNNNNNLFYQSSISVRPPHQKFFLPLIYLGATASLCYLFLFALVISNNETLHSSSSSSSKSFERGGFLQLALFGYRSNNSEKLQQPPFYNSDPLVVQQAQRVNNNNSKSNCSTAPETRDRQESSQLVLSSSRTDSAPFLSSSSAAATSTTGRKTLFSLRKKKKPEKSSEPSKNGTRRSHSPKVWPGHQDLGQNSPTILPDKGYKHSSKPAALPGVYYYPWKKDEQCKHFNVHFADKNTFKPRALVSFPGSGNSWLRYLIENASGYFTGSVYNDKQLFRSGLLGELRPPNDGTTIVQKTHHGVAGNRNTKGYVKLSELMFGYRGILVIRNPYDAIVSFRNYLKSRSGDRHTGIAKDNEFDGEGWATFVKKYIPDWSSLIMSWIENSQDYLIVLYEDVQKHPRRELTRILEYLNQPVDPTRLDCLMKQENLEGPFHRAHRLTESISHVPLPLDSLPSSSSTTATAAAAAATSSTTTSQQDTKIHVERQARKVKSSSHSHHHHHGHHPHIDEQPLLLLDSKKSQQPPQQHLQSESPPPQTRGKIREEQKEDKFLSSSFQTISSTNSLHQEQQHHHHHHHHHQQNPYTSKIMTSSRSSGGVAAAAAAAANNITTTSPSSSSLTTDDIHNDDDDNNNNRLNKGSILRLDLIIQDNIDKINRFFQHKSIPVQFRYSLRPSTMPYFLHRTYINTTTTTTTTAPHPTPFSIFSL